MSVYLIAQIEIRDRDEYMLYQAGFMEVFSKFEGETLIVDENSRVLEGDWPYTRTVLIRFPNEEEAMKWYNSPEYQKLAQHRLKSSRGNIIIASGLEQTAT